VTEKFVCSNWILIFIVEEYGGGNLGHTCLLARLGGSGFLRLGQLGISQNTCCGLEMAALPYDNCGTYTCTVCC